MLYPVRDCETGLYIKREDSQAINLERLTQSRTHAFEYTVQVKPLDQRLAYVVLDLEFGGALFSLFEQALSLSPAASTMA